MKDVFSELKERAELEIKVMDQKIPEEKNHDRKSRYKGIRTGARAMWEHVCEVEEKYNELIKGDLISKDKLINEFTELSDRIKTLRSDGECFFTLEEVVKIINEQPATRK